MIIIRCSGEYAFGGRTEDTFVVENCRNLNELQAYIENKQPLLCKEPTRYDKGWIIVKEGLVERIVYLNNYLKIREVNYEIMNKGDIEQLDRSVCRGCENNDGSLTGYLQCQFVPDSKMGCSNFSESFRLIKKWLGKSRSQ